MRDTRSDRLANLLSSTKGKVPGLSTSFSKASCCIAGQKKEKKSEISLPNGHVDVRHIYCPRPGSTADSEHDTSICLFYVYCISI